MSGGGDLDAGAAIAASDVLAFWRAAGPDKWFAKDAAFDSEIARRFFRIWRAGGDGELAAWQETPAGALALLVVLDQFPRNMFRGDRRTYETDGLARDFADRAIMRGFDRRRPHPDAAVLPLPLLPRRATPSSGTPPRAAARPRRWEFTQ